MKNFLLLVVIIFLSYNSFALTFVDGKAVPDVSDEKKIQNLEGLLESLKKAGELGLTVDFENTAKTFGFTSFEQVVKFYSKIYDAPHIDVQMAKEAFIGIDKTINITYSKENLDKIFEVIINSNFKSASRYKKKYLNEDNHKAFFVTMNLEKELVRLAKDPNINTISAHTWGWWRGAQNSSEALDNVLDYCADEMKKYNIHLQECYVIDLNGKNFLYDFYSKYYAKKNNLENTKSNTNNIEKTEEIISTKNIFEISNDDKSGPIINCNQTEYRITENFIKLKCQIKDDSEIYKVFVNGNEIKNNLNNFEFKIENIPLDSSTYEIIAFDKMANQSQQIISVKRDFNYSTVDSENYLEPLISGKIKHKKSSNRIALVIGIKSYQDIPNTQFGDKDAMVFVDFARENLNIKESNIKYLFNEDARFFEIKKLNQWLKSKINSKTELFFFYSGHGANNEGESLILPSDFSPDLIADSSFTKKGFLNDIVNQYKPNHIYAFFDACFSGLGREGEQLIAGLRNISIAEEEVINDNISVFNSASGAEFSNDLSEAKHGLFSYYLMKGLEGEADSNSDRKITSNELFSFIQNNVSNKAIEIGRKQNPSYAGDNDRIILEW